LGVVQAEPLRRFAWEIFRTMEVPAEVATAVADHLVLSNLAGEYGRLVPRTLGQVKQVRPGPGVGEVLYPGEPEALAREQRAREGIPIPDALWRDLTGIALRFGVELPA
jgi:LDH2 family malate/lactate/ureidoglycolate dehydrogenase